MFGGADGCECLTCSTLSTTGLSPPSLVSLAFFSFCFYLNLFSGTFSQSVCREIESVAHRCVLKMTPRRQRQSCSEERKKKKGMMSFCAGQPQIRPAWALGFVGTRVGRWGDSPLRPVLRLPKRQLASRLVAKKKFPSAVEQRDNYHNMQCPLVLLSFRLGVTTSTLRLAFNHSAPSTSPPLGSLNKVSHLSSLALMRLFDTSVRL